MYQLNKASLMTKAVQVGTSTLASRFFGIIRELLMARYLGSGMLADAFFTAFKIPNLLRKIFAEGALSAAFVPTFVKTVREKGIEEANSLMTLTFIIFEGIVFLLCVLMAWQAQWVIYLVAPGFSAEQVTYTVSFFTILIPFILFLSSNALFAGALQSAGHFFVPALAPILLNVTMIVGLLICWTYNLSVRYFCFFILFGGFLQLCIHAITYFNLEFSFARVKKSSFKLFQEIVVTFIPCLLSMSIMEVSLFIDTTFASYLPEGSIALLYYANRFVGIPLGVFAVSFSTILLPHFVRISIYAPKRLSFYLLESAKIVFWVTIPTMLLMIFFSEKIFSTFFLSERFSYQHVQQARLILVAFVAGLFFFSLNKIILNIYYALNQRVYTFFIALAALIVNVTMDFMLIGSYQATGLALATTFSAIAQTAVSLWILHYFFKFPFYGRAFIRFSSGCIMQWLLAGGLFMIVYSCIEYSWSLSYPEMQLFFLNSIGYWLWAGPLALGVLAFLYGTRKHFNINLYFLD